MKSLTRQYDLLPPDKVNTPITIIGAGAVGGTVAMNLARMGFGSALTVYDFDKVDEVNLNSQPYAIHQLDMPKVEALKATILMNHAVTITAVNARWKPSTSIEDGIVISCADSMEVRKQVLDASTKSGTDVFIDGRMGGEAFSIYALKPSIQSEKQAYMKTWFPDDQIAEEKCTSKATMYTTAIISGLICKIVKDVVMDQRHTKTIHWQDNAFMVVKS